MASTLALRALLGTTLGLGALDLVWLDLELAPQLVGATPQTMSRATQTVAPTETAVVVPAEGSMRAAPTQPEASMLSAPTQPETAAPTQPETTLAAPTQPESKLAAPTQPAPALAALTQPEPKLAAPTLALAPIPRVESVYFASVSAEIEPAAREVLAGVARTATRDIVLIGHSDHRGDPALNQSLRMRRARAVRDHLAILGVSSDRVHVRAAEPARPTDEPEMWRDRRVEIHFAITPSAPAAHEGTGGSR